MTAILKREFSSYFKSVTGYIFLITVLLASGIMFFLFNLLYRSPSMESYFGLMHYVFILLIPIITMRLFAEEKKNKTDQILLTSPVSVWEIVLGKFFACLLLFLVAVAVELIYPIIISLYGGGYMIGSIITMYIGFVLLGASLISIGIFVSSCTENQIAAAVVSMVVMLFLFLFLNMIVGSIGNAKIAAVLNWLSVTSRYSGFSKGLLDLPSVVYYISFSGVFLFLTTRMIEKRRYN